MTQKDTAQDASAPDPLQAFAADLQTQHAKLTEAHDTEQVAAEAAWAKYEAAKTAVTEFRLKYGRVLRALDTP